MGVLRFHITYNQFTVFPEYEVWFIAMTANHQSFIVPNLRFELFRHKHINGFEYAEFHLSMNTRNSFISKIVAHNKKRHNGEPFVVFREAIHIKKNDWKIIDYPPDGNSYC